MMMGKEALSGKQQQGGKSMKRNRNKFSAFDASPGKVNTRKVPKWRCSSMDLLEYLDSLEEEGDEVIDTPPYGF